MRNAYLSDTHFGHRNIIRYCQRPFASVEEMDDRMLEGLVRADEEGRRLFHLGDWGFQPKELLGHGGPFDHPDRHTFLAGNHDKVARPTYRSYYEDAFGRVVGTEKTWRANTLVVEDTLDGEPVTLLLSHAPQRDLQGADYNLYGHHHSNLQLDPERHREDLGWLYASGVHIGVSVELVGYRPRTLDELVHMRETLGLELR